MNKFWEFKNIGEDEAELMLYGEIASERPWWDWEDETVTQKQFIEDIKALGDKQKITVRINSVGGDIFAAHAIYTQLKTNKASIEVVVDGLAASAATIVAMAGDTVKMPMNAMMMIHNPSVGMMGFYDAEQLDKTSDTLNQIKESIISAYEVKTKMDRKDLSKLMNKESWLTANEAKEYGFADEVMFDISLEPEISNDGRFLFINSIQHDLSKYKNIPVQVKQAVFNTKQPQNSKGDEPMAFKNVEELRNACPNLVQEIENAAKDQGAKEERERLKGIDEIANNMDPQLVNKAKYEEPINAEKLALNAVKMDLQKAKNYLNDISTDVSNSNIDNVTIVPAEQKEEEIKNKVSNIAAGANRMLNRRK